MNDRRLTNSSSQNFAGHLLDQQAINPAFLFERPARQLHRLNLVDEEIIEMPQTRLDNGGKVNVTLARHVGRRDHSQRLRFGQEHLVPISSVGTHLVERLEEAR